MIFSPALPEIILALAALAALMLSVSPWAKQTGRLALAVLVALALWVGVRPPLGEAFFGFFQADAYAGFAKIFLLLAGGATVALALGTAPVARGKTVSDRPWKSEFFVLILFGTLGLLAMVSATDLIAFYLALELQNMALYVLTAFRRDEPLAPEAGLKYFVLSALASGLLLYGLSLLYGVAGGTGYEALEAAVAAKGLSFPPLLLGLAFFGAGIAFKLSAAPFHMWTPDIYEGASTPVVAFFSAAPKLAALAALGRFLFVPALGLSALWGPALIGLAGLSMLWGSLGGLVQGNLKRLMGYSSIANMGTALVGLAAAQGALEAEREGALAAALLVMIVTMLANFGLFALLSALRREGREPCRVAEFAGLLRANPLAASLATLFLLSLAGAPPLGGFFGKYFALSAAVESDLLPLAILGVLTSVVAAGYYLRVVKIMMFDDPLPGETVLLPQKGPLGVALVCAGALVTFALWVSPLLGHAREAARALGAP